MSEILTALGILAYVAIITLFIFLCGFIAYKLIKEDLDD